MEIEKRINKTAENFLLLMTWLSIAGACAGAWWQLFFVAMLAPVWGVLHRENHGRHRRGWLGWALAFLCVARTNPDKTRSIVKWNPLAWVFLIVVCLVGGIVAAGFDTVHVVQALAVREFNLKTRKA